MIYILCVMCLMFGAASRRLSSIRGEDEVTQSNSRRRLQSPSSNATEFRIIVDTTVPDNRFKNDASKVDKYVFSKKIMMKTADFFMKYFKVKFPKTTQTYPNIELDEQTTIKGRTFTGDLFVTFDCYDNSTDGIFAYAYPIFVDQDTGRPILGGVVLNQYNVNATKRYIYNVFSTLVHEFYHILAFNDGLYEYFIGSDKKPLGRSYLVNERVVLNDQSVRFGFKGPNVLAWARSHLSDSSLGHVLMENDGGSGSAGSHWEHKYWPTEFMSPTDTVPSLYSGLSFSLAKDSGWYDVDIYSAELMIQAKGAGPNYQSGSCPSSSAVGFCSSANAFKNSCSADYKHKAFCYSDPTFTEGCYFLYSRVICSTDDTTYGGLVDSSFDSLGADSRCLMTKRTNETSMLPRCATASCSQIGTISYKLKSITCECRTSDAGLVRTCGDGSTTFTCPSSASMNDICTNLLDANKCPKDCSGQGICMGTITNQKSCFCMFGWTGLDCATPNLSETDAQVMTWVNNTKDSSSGVLRREYIMMMVWIALWVAA